MKKYLYIVVGSAILVLALLMIGWFWSDFAYVSTSSTSQVRLLILLSTLFFGFSYLYFGIKHEKINLLTHVSFVVLLAVPILLILTTVLGCHRVGGPCTDSELFFQYVASYVIPLGIAIDFLILLASLIVSSLRRQNSLTLR